MSTGFDRATLKTHFAHGSRPSATDFEHLIDATLNLAEDGFSRTDRDGLRVHAQKGHNGVFAFYRDLGSDELLWSAGFDGAKDQWVMRPGDASADPLLTLDRERRMGLSQPAPRCRLDVNGSVSLRGRLGQPPDPRVAEQQSQELGRPVRLVADGSWKDLTGDLVGCQGFEVMAGAGKLNDRSRLALLHAHAFNVYHPPWWQNLLGEKRRIRAQHAFYARRRHRLELRWHSPYGEHGKDARYRLQIRSGCDYVGHLRQRGQVLDAEQEVPLHVYLTRLWFQPRMGPLDMEDGTP